jgi:hypothetical protein
MIRRGGSHWQAIDTRLGLLPALAAWAGLSGGIHLRSAVPRLLIVGAWELVPPWARYSRPRRSLRR